MSHTSAPTRALLAAGIALWAATAAAQPASLVLDGSLGPAGPIEPNAAREYHVTDAHGVFSAGGENRFHSFSHFNLLNASETAVFSSLAAPQRVIVRVTQPDPFFLSSNIQGTLRSTIPGADLYLLNPYGIRFGSQATVDVQGAFYAGTADVLRFGDGVDFPTGESVAPAALSVAAPTAFGFRGGDPARIDISGANGFAVSEGEVLGFYAGGFDLNRSDIRSPGATVQLAAASGPVDLPVELGALGAADLPAPAGDALGPGGIQLRDSQIDVSSPGGGGTAAGRIVIRGGHFVMEESTLGAVQRQDGVAGAGPLAIDAEVNGSIGIGDGSLVLSASESDAAAGGIRLAGPEVAVHESRVASEAHGAGAGGEVEIVAETLLVSNAGNHPDGSFVATFTDSPLDTGSGGELTVRADRVELVAGGQLLARTDGAADAGTLEIVGADFVSLAGVDSIGRPSGIVARAEESSAAGARGGDIALEMRVLEVGDGAQISAATFGAGDAGNLTIHAAESVAIRGGGNGASVVSAASRFPDGEARPLGQSGAVTLDTGSLELSDGGQLSVSTGGTHDAGNLVVRAHDVSISGTDPLVGNAAGVFARSNLPAPNSGDGGDIGIRATGDIEIANGGRVSVQTLGGGSAGQVALRADGRVRVASGGGVAAQTSGQGGGGSITIEGQRGVAITDGAQISARSLSGDTNPGDAGDITIDAGPRLDLVNASIDTESRGASGGRIEVRARDVIALQDARITTSVQDGTGGGGDVTIDPRFVVLQRSQIVAQAIAGPGGNIRIRAGSFLASPDSLVDASSQLGIDGNVSIESPNPELTGKLAVLPQAFLDASELLGDACLARTATEGSFVVRGRGVPPPPDAPLSLESGSAQECAPAPDTP